MPNKKTNSNPIQTVLVITIGFLVLFLLSSKTWCLYVAMTIGLIGLTSNFLAEKIDWFWTKLSWVLSLIVPNIIMTLIFYLFLTPIAIVSRIFGKSDPIDLKNAQVSMFKIKNGSYSKESFEKPW